jgi:hypothetical protein
MIKESLCIQMENFVMVVEHILHGFSYAQFLSFYKQILLLIVFLV